MICLYIENLKIVNSQNKKDKKNDSHKKLLLNLSVPICGL